MGRAPLILIVFGVISVLLTAGAAWLAMHRPDVERLDVETRSRLQADYSVDSLARRIEPLDPNIVRAAASDEARLTQQQTSAEPPRRVTPADVTPVATAAPTNTPGPNATAVASATAPPGSTGTTRPSDPTTTSVPGTPQPSGTPVAGKTPAATAALPSATGGLPTATVPPLPTTVPTLLPTLIPTNTSAPPTNTPLPTSTPVPTSTPTATPTATATPTSVIGGLLNALSCSVLGTIGSLPGGGQTTITFVNESGETIKVYELPTLVLGNPILRATVADGDDYTRNTSIGFAFMVTDMDDNCIAIYRAVAGGGTALID